MKAPRCPKCNQVIDFTNGGIWVWEGAVMCAGCVVAAIEAVYPEEDYSIEEVSK
jgi:hypothetical protein